MMSEKKCSYCFPAVCICDDKAKANQEPPTTRSLLNDHIPDQPQPSEHTDTEKAECNAIKEMESEEIKKFCTVDQSIEPIGEIHCKFSSTKNSDGRKIMDVYREVTGKIYSHADMLKLTKEKEQALRTMGIRHGRQRAAEAERDALQSKLDKAVELLGDIKDKTETGDGHLRVDCDCVNCMAYHGWLSLKEGK